MEVIKPNASILWSLILILITITTALVLFNKEMRKNIPANSKSAAYIKGISEECEDKPPAAKPIHEEQLLVPKVSENRISEDMSSVPRVPEVKSSEPEVIEPKATQPKAAKPKIEEPKGQANKADNTVKALENFSQDKLYKYLSIEENRQKVMEKALKFNNGQYVNACVYFIAEALRQNEVYIPDSTCNTTGLTAELKKMGWTRSYDYKNLQPGDICFTTDKYDKSGAPSHTYVFMEWISPGNFDYAMVCDNQADRYGTVCHKRNIATKDMYNGEKKEAFQYFMRK